jgi:hypothetical protein
MIREGHDFMTVMLSFPGGRCDALFADREDRRDSLVRKENCTATSASATHGDHDSHRGTRGAIPVARGVRRRSCRG